MKIGWMKPSCHMGNHLIECTESYLMNTNMTWFRWLSQILCSCMHWTKVALAIEGLSQVTQAWQWFRVQCGLIQVKEIFLRFNQFMSEVIVWASGTGTSTCLLALASEFLKKGLSGKYILAWLLAQWPRWFSEKSSHFYKENDTIFRKICPIEPIIYFTWTIFDTNCIQKPVNSI